MFGCDRRIAPGMAGGGGGVQQMTGRIVVLDPSAESGNLRDALAAKGYEVEFAESLRAARRLARPDAVLAALVPVGAGDEARLELAVRLAGDTLFSRCGVIAIGRELPPAARQTLLRGGVIDVLDGGPDRRFLAARLRALGRPRSVADELALREETARALGLEDAPALASTVPGRISVHASDIDAALRLVAALGPHVSDRLSMAGAHGASPAEVGLLVVGPGDDPDTVADMRARLRDARLLALLPEGQGADAAAALDFGADDVAAIGDDPAEIALRLRALMRQAQDRARCRSRVADGLASAHRDALTGLWNRRYAEPHLARLVRSAEVGDRPLSVLMIDIDRFKSVNDRFGHPAGDAVLREVASRLDRSLRAADLLARFGGEEFLVTLPNTDPVQARIVAERLCVAVAERPVPLPGGAEAALTVSAGLAHLRPGSGGAPGAASALVAAADRALYASKAAGRARMTEDA